MKTRFVILFFLVGGLSHAQQKEISINWVDKKEVSSVESSSIVVPGFDEQHFHYNYKNKQLVYSAQWKTGNYISSGKIFSVSTRPISKNLLKDIELKKIPKQIDFHLSTQKARNQFFSVIRLNPLINDHGTYKKIISFKIAYSKETRRGLSPQKTAILANSVLSNGNWFKFYIEKNGIHKLTYDFLRDLGLDVSSINPDKLKIYGHGGGMLPLQNNRTKYSDLPQTSIQVVGGNDGSFDPEDYILFYGESTKGRQNMLLPAYKTNINLYATHSYYYITADGINGNRVSLFTPPSGQPTTTITTYDDYQFYEVDKYSLVKVGRRWFGDRFSIQNQRSYTFNFSNIVQNEPMTVKIMAAATAEVPTSMSVQVNGQGVPNLLFSAITDHAYASGANFEKEIPASSETVIVNLSYNNGGVPSSTGYLDFISIEAKRKLIADKKQFDFRYKAAANLPGIGKYVLSNTTNITQIWDITNRENILSIPNSANSPSISFKANLGEIHEYVAISQSDYYTPLIGTNPRVANQNLKGSVAGIDYLIITNALLAPQANRLAQYRRKTDDLNVKVVLLNDIYTEFNSGKPGVAAIRNFVKYVYDLSPSNHSLKYLCLFGDASVDYKNRLPGNNNMVPVFESYSSFTIGEDSFPSDDFYGMMDGDEGTMENNGKLDLAVGRIIADSPQLAKIAVDKIVAYESKSAYGSWRNNFVLISDDAEQGSGAAGYGLQVALDSLGGSISTHQPFINVYKIHSDAYQQQSSAGGARYPEVNKAISEAIETGALVINYLGHGGEEGLAQERILTVPDIQSWNNTNKYPVFLTITCEFTKFDNPLRAAGGEFLLWQEDAGAVATIATTRAITVSGGVAFNQALAPYLFNFEGEDYSISEAVRQAKINFNGDSKRVVFFFGDPAMKLAMPEPKISLTKTMDTLKALDHVKIAGKITTSNGAPMQNYNGVLSTLIFDKRIDRQTLNNDGSGVFEFTTLGEIIFRGKASVTKGNFEFDFVVPKDIRIPVGTGRISFYAKKNKILEDQTGYNNKILVGGINEAAPKDNIGPEITLYMNDENFVSGGVTNDSPFLLAHLSDKNGINTASGIGHDLVAILDGNETNPYVVNDYYETEIDDYTEGSVYYQLQDLEPGLHTLNFKAWDVYNNSSTAEIQFMVTGDDDLKITHVLNYPNPFHNYTEFWFNHNRPYEPLQVQVQVFTVTGKVVWTKNKVITTSGFLSREITWDGRDDFGNLIGKGVYIYKLTVKSTSTNDKVEKFEKLVIL